MKILAIDTSLGAASACLFDSAASDVLARETIWLERGHDQAIIPLIDRVVAQGGGRNSIERVAVTVGPGSFTGIRVGISAARAIGLATGAPVVGVSTLAAFVAPILLDHADGVAAAAIDARHGRMYVVAFASGAQIMPPRVAAPRDAVRAMGSGPLRLVGSGATALAIEAWSMGVAAELVSDAKAPDIALVARLGAAADPLSAPPRPLYLKAPDVTPSASLAIPAA
ncbi:MAG: tRNA (adenosine(37)-N6)-threonylcarbamoyltransferase complex dimerization subunit type 1 TsaB [Rhodoblastus sp.]